MDTPMPQPRPDPEQVKEAAALPLVVWKRAEEWWDDRGRSTMNRAMNRTEHGRKVAKGIVVPGEMTPETMSGILHGDLWSTLTLREQVHIVLTFARLHPDAQKDAAEQHLAPGLHRLPGGSVVVGADGPGNAARVDVPRVQSQRGSVPAEPEGRSGDARDDVGRTPRSG